MRPVFLAAACCLLAVLATPLAPARAQELEDGTLREETLSEERAVEQGREALDRAGNFPWYDEETDGLRRIEVRREPTPEGPVQMNSGRTSNPGGFSFPAWLANLLGGILPFMSWACPASLIVLLVFLAILFIRYITTSGGELQGGLSGDEEHDRRSEIDRIEALPFRMRKPFADLLSEARRCYEAGNFNDAIVYLYSYQLVHLDKRHLIRLTKGKTNRQYVREVKPRGGISHVLTETMLAFEEVFFGNHDLPRRRFEQCWNRLDEFHSMVDQHTAA